VVALEAQSRRRPVEAVSLAPGVVDTDMQGEIRGMEPAQFADVERFRAMKAEGALRTAEDVAADILRLEGEGRLVGDAVLDLRQLG
jgi:NAD(P)-dependent dehydrogenase (short-subunit alcohol dehydrogenase family)